MGGAHGSIWGNSFVYWCPIHWKCSLATRLIMNIFARIFFWIKVIRELLGLVLELPKLRKPEVSWVWHDKARTGLSVKLWDTVTTYCISGPQLFLRLLQLDFLFPVLAKLVFSMRAGAILFYTITYMSVMHKAIGTIFRAKLHSTHELWAHAGTTGRKVPAAWFIRAFMCWNVSLLATGAYEPAKEHEAYAACRVPSQSKLFAD